MDAKALFGILQTASNSTQRLAVAETIKDVVMEAAIRVDWAERFGHPLYRSLLLHNVPAALTSLGQSSDATATSSSAARAAAGPSKLAELLAAGNSQRLQLQVHALLATVVKCAGSLNARALRSAAAAAPAPAGSISGSSSSRAANAGSSQRRGPPTDEERAAVLAQIDAMLPPAYKAAAKEMVRQINASPARAEIDAGFARMAEQMNASLEAAKASRASAPAADRVGQFRGSLELISSAAAAAAALGRAVGQAAAASTSNNDAAGSSTVPLTAPFGSLIGRCLHLTGAALEGASKEPKLGAAEFSSVSPVLETLLSSLDWVVADTAYCRELLASTGAADAAAVDSLRTSLQQQLAQLKGSGLQGQAVADVLRDSGLAGQLQSVGGAMCGVVTGVCGNPACSSLSELSEIALVTPGGGKKGCGKCAACASVSYCSRGCQVKHWKGHKVFCNARKQATAT